MYTLYGSTGSGSAAVEMALQLCKLPFRLVEASSWQPESALAELEGLNPLKQIPTLLLPGGEVMSESAAILIHLGLQHRSSGLLPTEPSARAQALRGLVYIAANCYAAIGVIDYPERWCSSRAEAVHAQVRRGARRRLHFYWDLFADQFAGSSIFGAAAPAALDLLAVVVSKWSGTRAHLAKSRPDLLASLLRIETHPLVAQVLEKHWPAEPTRA